LDDHQQYSTSLIDRLIAEAQRSGARALLTTEKDLVKLTGLAPNLPLPLYGLRMKVEAGAQFSQEILRVVQSWRKLD
jgi:tetraacyldisaccharide 4'-kinase